MLVPILLFLFNMLIWRNLALHFWAVLQLWFEQAGLMLLISEGFFASPLLMLNSSYSQALARATYNLRLPIARNDSP